MRLVNAGTPLQDDDLFELLCPSLVHLGSSVVFKGQLKISGEPLDSKVVCKMVERDMTPLEAEAKFYTATLQDIQHRVVLRFFLYATAEKDVIRFACMLTRYCRRAMTGRWGR